MRNDSLNWLSNWYQYDDFDTSNWWLFLVEMYEQFDAATINL